MRFPYFAPILILSWIIISGCSKESGVSVSPVSVNDPFASKQSGRSQGDFHRDIRGLYEVAIDTESGVIEAVPLRTSLFRAKMWKLKTITLLPADTPADFLSAIFREPPTRFTRAEVTM